MPAYGMRLDDATYSELRIEDQRDVPFIIKWSWLDLPKPIFRHDKKINLRCLFKPKSIYKMKVVFFDKHKNYILKIKCGVTK